MPFAHSTSFQSISFERCYLSFSINWDLHKSFYGEVPQITNWKGKMPSLFKKCSAKIWSSLGYQNHDTAHVVIEELIRQATNLPSNEVPNALLPDLSPILSLTWGHSFRIQTKAWRTLLVVLSFQKPNTAWKFDAQTFIWLYRMFCKKQRKGFFSFNSAYVQVLSVKKQNHRKLCFWLLNYEAGFLSQEKIGRFISWDDETSAIGGCARKPI